VILLDFPLNIFVQISGYVITYLLGMAFAGSILGRRWMGTCDVFLHKLFKLQVTMGKYLYWKHFCSIPDPPKPPQMKKARNWGDQLLCRFISILD
jgi:hypothetical protein